MKIAIDCGHGSNTAGKRTAPFFQDVDINGDGNIDIKKGEQYREHYASVMVATYLEKELLRCGFDIFKSAWNDANGTDDPDVTLSVRQANIKAAKCDLSISIHFNAYGDGQSFNSAEGVGIYVHSDSSCIGDSMEFAQKVQEQLINGSKQKNRGITKSQLSMCNCRTLGVKAAILPELAFMTNEREAHELMANEEFCKECAVEIAKGICDYTGVKYVAEFPYQVIITREKGVPVRKEPNSKSEEVTRIACGKKRWIVKEENGFGMMKNEKGWIRLNYTEEYGKKSLDIKF